MRLIQKDLKDIYVFIATEVPSDDVGTVIVTVKMRTIKGIISIIQNKMTIEIFGGRIAKMLEVTTQDALALGEYISLSSTATKPEYKVISVIPFSQHKECLVEVI